MLGTTLKLGFDGSSVDRGLGGITGKFGRVGRQIGIGMARQVGARMTDMLGRVLMAIPDTLKETADWAGNMNDMATQTGMTVGELVLLEEKLRLSGAAAADTSRIISTLKDNIYEAMNAEGPERDALHKLGFRAFEFEGNDPSEIFEKIGKRVAELGPKFEGLEGTMADLFGARMGYKLLRFFNDFEGSTKQAENNVGKLAVAMGDGAAAKMDTFGDSLERFDTFKRSLASIALENLFRGPGGENMGNRLFDALDPEKLRPMIENLTTLLGRNLEVVLSGDAGIGDIFKNIGKILGDGLKEKLYMGIEEKFQSLGRKLGEGLKETFNFSPSGIFKGMFPGKDKDKPMDDSEMKRQTSLLEDIRSNGKTARFA